MRTGPRAARVGTVGETTPAPDTPKMRLSRTVRPNRGSNPYLSLILNIAGWFPVMSGASNGSTVKRVKLSSNEYAASKEGGGSSGGNGDTK